MYRIARPLLFRFPPERAHDLTLALVRRLASSPAALERVARRYAPADARLAVEAFGLRFPGPVGLAAGLDKNAVAVRAWPAFGFGHVEIGSVTAHGQAGNPQPRLFRLPEDRALINRMGFNNDGSERVAARLRQDLEARGPYRVPLGANLGKSKVTPLEEAHRDYVTSLERLWAHADYFVVNVSSPNTPGLRALQDREPLDVLLGALTRRAAELAGGDRVRPLLLKIAPDLTWPQVDEVLELAQSHRVSGLIATNTTILREGLTGDGSETGGLSGAPLTRRSLEVLRYVRKAAPGLPVVSVGGVMTTADVLERLRLGAVLVQAYTGFVYGGPAWVRGLNEGVRAELERRGAASVADLAAAAGK